MGLKHLLNTNLASFYDTNPFEVEFANGGLDLENTSTLTPGPSEENAFGVGVNKVQGNIRFRSIAPESANDNGIFNKIGLGKNVGAIDTLSWSDGLNGSKSDYPLMWTNIDPIDKPYSSPTQNTLLFNILQTGVHSFTDGVRISRFFSPLKIFNKSTIPLPEDANGWQKFTNSIQENFSSNYLIFKGNQKILALQSPLTPGVERGFNVANLILTSATQGLGPRWQTAYNAPLTGVSDLRNINFKDLNALNYKTVTKNNDDKLINANGNANFQFPASRLTGLYVSKIVGYEIGEPLKIDPALNFFERQGAKIKDSFSGNRDRNNITPAESKETLLRYYGGAEAPFGAFGFTTIGRWEFTNTENILKEGASIWQAFSDKEGNVKLPSSEQTTPISFDTASQKTISNGPSFVSSIERYKKFNMENQYKGDVRGYGMSGGGSLNYDLLPKDTKKRIDFLKSTKKQKDFINAQVSYDGVNNTKYENSNLIKFSIEIIDNDTPGSANNDFLHFRAFIDQFQDSYKPKWDGYRYVGRAEEFYRYSSFGRDINLGFTVAAFARVEMYPLYKKINKLVGITAPDYSTAGLMRGNIIRLTVGYYLTAVPGILTGLSLTPIFDAGWDINRDNDGKYITRPNPTSTLNSPDLQSEGYTGQLPIAIKVDGFNFTPIHNFTPTKDSPFINFGNHTYNPVKQDTIA